MKTTCALHPPTLWPTDFTTQYRPRPAVVGDTCARVPHLVPVISLLQQLVVQRPLHQAPPVARRFNVGVDEAGIKLVEEALEPEAWQEQLGNMLVVLGVGLQQSAWKGRGKCQYGGVSIIRQALVCPCRVGMARGQRCRTSARIDFHADGDPAASPMHANRARSLRVSSAPRVRSRFATVDVHSVTPPQSLPTGTARARRGTHGHGTYPKQVVSRGPR